MDTLQCRFYMAVCQCAGEHTLKPRLTQAWIEYLDTIEAELLPPSLQNEFLNIRGEMYKEVPMPGEHAARASVRKMSQKQAAAITSRIVSLFRELMNLSFSESIREAESQANAASETAYAPQTGTLLN